MIAWSYTGLSNYETCPFKFKREKIDKAYPFQESEATQWGTKVHKALEERVRDGKPLDKEVAHYEPLAAKLADMEGDKFFERQFCYNSELVPVDWFHPTAWLRAVVDLYIKRGSVIRAVDYKTNAKMKSDFDQLRLFAAVLMMEHPDVDTVEVKYLWLTPMKATSKTYTRDDYETIWREFMERAEKIEQSAMTDNWPKKRNGLCRKWCPVKDCEFSG